MRRSTVLSLPLHIVFPGLSIALFLCRNSAKKLMKYFLSLSIDLNVLEHLADQE